MEKHFTEEERDLFAMSFLVFVLSDARAQALIKVKTPTKALLDLYKDRAYLHEDGSHQ